MLKLRGAPILSISTAVHINQSKLPGHPTWHMLARSVIASDCLVAKFLLSAANNALGLLPTLAQYSVRNSGTRLLANSLLWHPRLFRAPTIAWRFCYPMVGSFRAAADFAWIAAPRIIRTGRSFPHRICFMPTGELGEDR